MKYQISFIVPAYNSGKYIARCLDSLIKQDITSEIIVVDDASTDNTNKICQEYKKKYKNIVIVALDKNQGVSNARNEGVKKANGEFIYFVDSDDYILENSCLRLLNDADKYDMVIFGKVYDYNGLLNKCKFPFVGSVNFTELIKNNLLLFLNVHTSCWITNKLYRTSIIKNNNILFEKNLEFAEDLMFNLIYFKFCNNIIYKEEYVTFYNRNVEGSLSRKYEKKNVSEVVNKREYLYSYLKSVGVSNFEPFYLDTKNIIMYATKKVLKACKDEEEKNNELLVLKNININIVNQLDLNKELEKLLYNYIVKNDKKILRWTDEKL